MEVKKSGRPVSQPCGTPAAYARHLRHGETPCELCRQANAARHRELYQRRKASSDHERSRQVID